jgi:serine/threonine-protein kinase
MNQHVTQDPPSILTYKPDLSPRLATVVMKAIRRAPEKRFRSMREMQYMLQNLDAVKAIAYEPDAPQAHRVRQQVVLTTLIVIAICLAIIAVGLVAQIVHNAAH